MKNMTKDQFRLMVGQEYNNTPKRQGARDAYGELREIIGKKYCVSGVTVSLYAKFATRAEQDPELMAAILAGEKIKHYPNNTNNTPGCALYRHYNAAGELLYVGIAANPLARTGQHSKRAPWFGEVATITIERHTTRGEAERAELDAIAMEHPKYNVVGA